MNKNFEIKYIRGKDTINENSTYPWQRRLIEKYDNVTVKDFVVSLCYILITECYYLFAHTHTHQLAHKSLYRFCLIQYAKSSQKHGHIIWAFDMYMNCANSIHCITIVDIKFLLSLCSVAFCMLRYIYILIDIQSTKLA